MVDAMKVNEKASSTMLAPPRVIQLPAEIEDLEDLACVAFLSVATAWKVPLTIFLYYGVMTQLHERLSYFICLFCREWKMNSRMVLPEVPPPPEHECWILILFILVILDTSCPSCQ